MSLFNNNPALNLATLILAVLGIFFTAYFYFRSRKSKAPTYTVRTINLVRDNLSKISTLDILYSGKKINNLSISKIALWNDGQETINSTDIAPLKPLIIIINNEYDILDVGILFQKNDANNFNINISEDKKSVDITFDYFDNKEGMVLQIFHTGNYSEDIRIEGKIKSVKNINRRDFNPRIYANIFPFLPKRFSNSKVVKTIYGGIIFAVGLALFSLPAYYCIEWFFTFREWYGLGFAEVFLLGYGGLLIFIGYKNLKKKIPKGYDRYISTEF